MKIDVVGPPLWRSLHAITFAYPQQATPEHTAAAVALFDALVPLFPCDKCRPHLAAELKRHPVAEVAGGRETFARWLVDLHNRVNARLGKPQWTFEQAATEYGALDCGENCAASPTSETTPTSPPSDSVSASDSYWFLLIALAFCIGVCVALCIAAGVRAWLPARGVPDTLSTLGTPSLRASHISKFQE